MVECYSLMFLSLVHVALVYRAVTVLSCANFDSQKIPEHARLLQDLHDITLLPLAEFCL